MLTTGQNATIVFKRERSAPCRIRHAQCPVNPKTDQPVRTYPIIGHNVSGLSRTEALNLQTQSSQLLGMFVKQLSPLQLVHRERGRLEQH